MLNSKQEKFVKIIVAFCNENQSLESMPISNKELCKISGFKEEDVERYIKILTKEQILCVSEETQGKSAWRIYKVAGWVQQEYYNQNLSFYKKIIRPEGYKPTKKKILTNLYFISDELETVVKIGISQNSEARIKTHQTGNSVKLKNLKEIKNIPAALEKEIHAKFAHLRKNGEWFELTEELKLYIKYLEIPDCILKMIA